MQENEVKLNNPCTFEQLNILECHSKSKEPENKTVMTSPPTSVLYDMAKGYI